MAELISDIKDPVDRDAKNIMNIEAKSIRNYNKQVEQELQKYADKKEGFCGYCAISVYEDYKNELTREVQKAMMGPSAGRKQINIDEQLKKFKVDFHKFHKYMELVNITTSFKHTRTDRTPVKVWYKNFKCKTCGGGHSIECDEDPSKKK